MGLCDEKSSEGPKVLYFAAGYYFAEIGLFKIELV
jgi:hypothetical protein